MNRILDAANHARLLTLSRVRCQLATGSVRAHGVLPFWQPDISAESCFPLSCNKLFPGACFSARSGCMVVTSVLLILNGFGGLCVATLAHEMTSLTHGATASVRLSLRALVTKKVLSITSQFWTALVCLLRGPCTGLCVNMGCRAQKLLTLSRNLASGHKIRNRCRITEGPATGGSVVVTVSGPLGMMCTVLLTPLPGLLTCATML